MKVKINEPFEAERTVDLAQHIFDQLDGDDYDRGALEVIETTIDSTRRLLGVLIDILAVNKTLTAKDLSNIIGNKVELS